jgi:histidinol-phosphate aminotransferase
VRGRSEEHRRRAADDRVGDGICVARRRECHRVPLRNDYAHDLDAMLAAGNGSTGLIYVCNPNNPTGSMTRRRELNGVLGRLPAAAHLLVDEAYGDYLGGSSEYASLLDQPVDDRRVIVARTFSSIHGLADLNIGYAVAALETAERIASYRRQQEISAGAAGRRWRRSTTSITCGPA